MMPLDPEYQPELIEATVLVALGGHPEERGFRRERDRLYEIPDVEAREVAFTRLGVRWFVRLGLDRALREALGEQPAVAAGCGRAIVAPAVDRRAECADLLVAATASRTLLVRLTPETLSAHDRALLVLRHELFHVADMLDPAFGYERRLAGPEAGSPRDHLLRDRYRALWDAFIDGRLARLGRAPAGAREERWRDFRQAFPELGERAEAAFERFWRARRRTHADLMAFVVGDTDAARRLWCQLCGFPTGAGDPARTLQPDVLAAIGEDFPSWDSLAGLCSRCAELYGTRAAARRQLDRAAG